jgi:uncharacterized membrane protein
MIKSFFTSIVATVLLDAIWIGLIMMGFYKTQLGPILRLKPDGGIDAIAWAGGIVYVLIALGVVFFVLPKISDTDPLWMVLPWGFLFGIILYGVYDFTNYSLLKDWTLAMTLVDCTWGGVLCALSSLAALYVQRWMAS